MDRNKSHYCRCYRDNSLRARRYLAMICKAFCRRYFFSPSLSIRIRIWWHRRETKSWYDEYLYHQRAIEAHRRATLECIAKGNEHHQAALWLEAESKA